jgi:septal ring factor EnvC (AmiA/AmiB activator)
MIRMRWTIFMLVLAFGAAALAGEKDDILKNRNKLDNVKRDVEQGRKKLDSLKVEETRLLKASVNYDQRISSEKKLVSRLGSQLTNLRATITQTEKEQTVRQRELEDSHSRFLENIRQFYCLARSPEHLSLADPNSEVLAGRQVAYLTAVTGYQQGSILSATGQIIKAKEKLTNLSGKSAELEALKRRKETNVALQQTKQEKAEKALARVRRLSRQQADRLVSLEQSASEMERIVSRLEAQRKAAAAKKNKPTVPSSSSFALKSGSLPMPYRGEIIQSFGPSVDPVTNLRSYSPGITIKGKAGTPVIAVAGGVVAYAGDLRGYGRFVIINHDDQYYTTYAGLAGLTVGVGDRVASRARLGAADQTGLVRFELRKGGEEIDPVTWLNDE